MTFLMNMVIFSQTEFTFLVCPQFYYVFDSESADCYPANAPVENSS